METRTESIDEKIARLLLLTDQFLLVEYYPHTNCQMYKIHNEYTRYREYKCVLEPVTEGIALSLDAAIAEISRLKEEFEQEGLTKS